MNTEDFEDLFVDVIAQLRAKFGEEQIRDWGYMTIKDWVRDEVEQNESATAKEIADNIWLDWRNERA
jgi:hypothetical protein